MPTAIRFYRDVLGFEVTDRSKALSENPDDVNWAMLKLNGATLMLNTAYDRERRGSAIRYESQAQKFLGDFRQGPRAFKFHRFRHVRGGHYRSGTTAVV
jgi:uncharacterized glyoxalase superfamily protein PhnB